MINETLCRNGNIEDGTFTFTKIGVFVHHLKKLGGLTNIPDLFKKALKMAERAEVILSDAKPATISYNNRTEKWKSILQG